MRIHPDAPDYYLYQKDGAWFKTDERLTKLISAHIFGKKDVQLPKVVFYPNWNDKGLPGAKYVAWRVNEFGEMVVRWYWRVKDHSKKCRQCKKLDNGRCAQKVPALIEWSDVAHRWALAPLSMKASEEESKVLDKM